MSYLVEQPPHCDLLRLSLGPGDLCLHPRQTPSLWYLSGCKRSRAATCVHHDFVCTLCFTNGRDGCLPAEGDSSNRSWLGSNGLYQTNGSRMARLASSRIICVCSLSVTCSSGPRLGKAILRHGHFFLLFGHYLPLHMDKCCSF